MNKIDSDYMRAVCKIGQGADCCRYIVAGSNGITCAKHTELREVIDQRVAAGVFTATSDNCDGFNEGELK